jgi:thiamine-monophosphate kinase
MSGATSRQPQTCIADLTETEIVARIATRLPPNPDWLVVGIGDDAAVVETERNRLCVLSVDALVEGVHFDRAFTPPSAIGHRALAANLSDLAAMGARPRLALLSLALPESLLVADFDEIVGGLITLASAHRIVLAGGNLTRTGGPLVIDITVTGSAKRRQLLTRGGAQPGDELYVTGSIGGAAAGLAMLRAGVQLSVAELFTGNDSEDPGVQTGRTPDRPSVPPVAENCIRRYLYPDPRVRMGLLIGRNRAATACMDLSDGLADAVGQIADASGVGATIDASALPIDPAAREWFESRGADSVRESMTGGDDYELLIAVRPRVLGRLLAARRHGDAPLTRIGSCTADRAVLVRQDGTDRPLPRGYRHFR